MEILSELLTERTDFTGWVGFILISLCFTRLFSRFALFNRFTDKLIENHKRLGWFALTFLACHGLIGILQDSSEIWAIGSGLCTWLVLLVTCLTTLVVAPLQFKNRHMMMVISLAIIALLHIE